jgi:diazepam-binding inhibitor (GABA receptor modulating acyl-CoA-binding protein)
MLEEQFQSAIEIIKSNLENPLMTDELKLDAYKYYKQAIFGDCDTTKPNLFNFKESAKWNAWNSLKGISSDTAKENYIKLSYILR